MDGDTPDLRRRNLEQVRLGKKQPVFSSDDTSAGTRHLCSSETGSSLVWEVLLDARAFTEVSKGLVRAFGGRRKGLGFLKKGGCPLCITPREAWACFLCLTQVSLGTDWHMRGYVALCPERLGEIFDLMWSPAVKLSKERNWAGVHHSCAFKECVLLCLVGGIDVSAEHKYWEDFAESI